MNGCLSSATPIRSSQTPSTSRSNPGVTANSRTSAFSSSYIRLKETASVSRLAGTRSIEHLSMASPSRPPRAHSLPSARFVLTSVKTCVSMPGRARQTTGSCSGNMVPGMTPSCITPKHSGLRLSSCILHSSLKRILQQCPSRHSWVECKSEYLRTLNLSQEQNSPECDTQQFCCVYCCRPESGRSSSQLWMKKHVTRTQSEVSRADRDVPV